MREVTTMLSSKEAKKIEDYAQLHGITGEEAIGELAMSCIERRLKPRNEKPKGVVRTFELPKRG